MTIAALMIAAATMIPGQTPNAPTPKPIAHHTFQASGLKQISDMPSFKLPGGAYTKFVMAHTSLTRSTPGINASTDGLRMIQATQTIAAHSFGRRK